MQVFNQTSGLEIVPSALQGVTYNSISSHCVHKMSSARALWLGAGLLLRHLLAIEHVLDDEALLHRHLVLECDESKAPRHAIRFSEHLHVHWQSWHDNGSAWGKKTRVAGRQCLNACFVQRLPEGDADMQLTTESSMSPYCEKYSLNSSSPISPCMPMLIEALHVSRSLSR